MDGNLHHSAARTCLLKPAALGHTTTSPNPQLSSMVSRCSVSYGVINTSLGLTLGAEPRVFARLCGFHMLIWIAPRVALRRCQIPLDTLESVCLIVAL